jgi:hypothetical protein
VVVEVHPVQKHLRGGWMRWKHLTRQSFRCFALRSLRKPVVFIYYTYCKK